MTRPPGRSSVRQNLNLKGISGRKNNKRNKSEQEKTTYLPASSRPRASADRPVTAILGDSTLKFINGNRLSKRLETKVQVKHFSGARIKDMKHYAIPTLEDLINPNEVVLHIGTNDLRDHEPREVAESTVDLAHEIVHMRPVRKIASSSQEGKQSISLAYFRGS